MKVFVGIFVMALAAATAAAQDTQPVPAAPKAPAQPISVLGGFSGGLVTAVKNSPFTAEEVNESVQTLADGNRIVRNSKSKMYRNSEGRIRREGGLGGAVGFAYTVAPSVSIVDPVIRQKYELDAALKTARVYDLKTPEGSLTVARAASAADQKAAEEALVKLKADGRLASLSDLKSREELIAKLKAEGKLDKVEILTAQGEGVKTITSLDGSGAYAAGFAATVKSRYETKTEDLGTRDFEGVSAEGSRRTTIIPEGAIGNERPIEVVYERWFSKDLGVVVYSKTTDPRSGEQTYKLTNIVRSEPDPSLFSVPTEYKKISEQGAIYRVSQSKAEAVKTTVSPKAVPVVAKPN